MAIYYGLECITCNTRTRCDIRKRQDGLQELVQHWLLLKQVHELNLAMDMLLYGDYEREQDWFGWVDEHYEHDIAIYDETGYTFAIERTQ